MPLLKPLPPSPPPATVLVHRAISILKCHHPLDINSLSSHFTPQITSSLLLKSQFDQPLILKILKWVRTHPFFDLNCKCITLHILTRFKLYRTAQTLAENVAIDDASSGDKGSLVFNCLKDSYQVSNSSSSVFDLMVKTYSHLNMIDAALNTVNLAKCNGFMPSVLSYNWVLDSVISNHKTMELAEQLYKDMTKIGVQPNVFTYNILIRGFCAIREFDRGLGFFSEMERIGCLPNVVTYNTLIHAHCKVGLVDEAYKYMKLLSVKNLEPNLISYNVIINGLCREGRMEKTSEILEEMSRKGLVPDEVTYNTLVNGYCKDGDFHQALVLHAKMIRNGLSPNVITYTSLISSMCKARNLHRAMEFFDQMIVRGLQPNERTYTTLIDGFCQQGCLDEAYRVLDEMSKSGFSPSIVTYNALINGHCISGRIEDGFKVLQDMTAKKLVPDLVSYSTLVSAFCRNQDLERAFKITRMMIEKGVLPDTITYSSLIKGLCEQHRLPEACDLFQDMMEKGLPPDECTYTTLINGHCVEGDINTALHLHAEMINKGLLPDVVTYSVLINGLSKQARTREAKQLLFKLYYEDSVPVDVTYNTLIETSRNIETKSVIALIKGFCMKGLMKEADRVFESMLQRDRSSSAAVYNIMIHGHCRCNNLQKAYNMYKEMMRNGFFAHTATIIALAKELRKDGWTEELNQVIENTLRSCQLADAELAKLLVQINNKEGNMDAAFNVLNEMARDGLLPNSGKSTRA